MKNPTPFGCGIFFGIQFPYVCDEFGRKGIKIKHPPHNPEKPKRRIGFVRLIVSTLIALLIVVIYGLFATEKLKAEEIISGSMEPTIKIGDRIIVSSFKTNQYHRGDVVVFKSTDQGDLLPLIKRIVGIPKDTIYVIEDDVLVNKKPDSKSFSKYNLSPIQIYTKMFVLKDGEYFVVGDNHEKSFDSRYFGPIKEENIQGKALYLYYPFSNFKNFNNEKERQEILVKYLGE